VTSRDKILSTIKNVQPGTVELPLLENIQHTEYIDPVTQYITTLQNIGGKAIHIKSIKEIAAYIRTNFTDSNNYISTIQSLPEIETLNSETNPHLLENIEVAVIPALIGIAENSAVWVTDKEIQIRALPFICQHLCVAISKKNIVSNMHQAYQFIHSKEYDFAVFIAGPSKTADIEQSLVLGAHGPKSMTIFLTE